MRNFPFKLFIIDLNFFSLTLTDWIEFGNLLRKNIDQEVVLVEVLKN